jgi:putative exporter of polyketide antibiotics
MLAVTLTVLAILLALPDRPALEDLRASDAWTRLQATLLATALLCLITLVSALLGAAIDDQATGKQWLDLLTITAGAMAVTAVLLSGVVFALFLRISQQPADPSTGRGQ